MNTPLQEHHQETPTERLDREFHATAAPLTGGLSPVSLSLAQADWAAWPFNVTRTGFRNCRGKQVKDGIVSGPENRHAEVAARSSISEVVVPLSRSLPAHPATKSSLTARQSGSFPAIPAICSGHERLRGVF